MKIIGLVGKKRSGKNLFADIVKDSYKDKIVKTYAFADPIKKAISEMFGWSLEYIENKKEVEDSFYGISPRQVLQNLGTQWAQYNLPDYCESFKNVSGRKLWCKRFHQWLKKDHNFDYTFLTDVRFPHEIEYVNTQIYFIKSLFVRIKRTDMKILDNHESESYIDNLSVDYEIENNGNYNNYKNNILRLIEKIEDGTNG